MLLLIILSGLYVSSDSSSYIPDKILSNDLAPLTVSNVSIWSSTTLTADTVMAEATTNVSGQLGSSVELQCRVASSLEDTSVSWVRRQEGQLRLLAVGLEPYTSDSRYSVSVLEPGRWSLKLKPLRLSDQGLYECQVPSHPPLLLATYLHVVVPELEVTDERDVPIKDKFYNLGSTIQLKCRLTKVPRPSHFLIWRHGDKILNYDVIRGGISVRTDLTEDGAWSRLLIAHATLRDSGNYSCSLADVASAYVTLHVLTGEIPAAMQRGGSSTQNRGMCWVTLILLMIDLLCR